MNKTCFVISPFGEPFDEHYEQIYKPAIESDKSLGLKAVRADEIYGTGAIINDIFTQIAVAELILCDVTGKNPNVNYELGVAHALQKPTVIITQSMEDVPFDYRHLRVIRYDQSKKVRWVKELEASISNNIKAALEDPRRVIAWQPVGADVSEYTLALVRSTAEREAPQDLADRKAALNILLGNRTLHKELVNNSILGSGVLKQYSYFLDDERQKTLESNLYLCIDEWLIVSLSNPAGASAGVKFLKSDSPMFRKLLIQVLEQMKDQVVVAKLASVDATACSKIQDYLNILIHKLTV